MLGRLRLANIADIKIPTMVTKTTSKDSKKKLKELEIT